MSRACAGQRDRMAQVHHDIVPDHDMTSQRDTPSY